MGLESIAQLVVAHGYIVLFIVIALDCVALPIPGELLLLTFGGVAVHAGLDIGVGVVVAALAVLVAESLSYWAGRLGGERVLRKLRFAQRWRLGTTTIVLGRFVVGARVVMAPLAGAQRLPFGRFLLKDALGATLWAGLFILAGHAARVNLPAVQRHWTNVTTTIEIGLAVLAAAWLAVKLLRLPRRLPIAVGIALISLATLRPATALEPEGDLEMSPVSHEPMPAVAGRASNPR